MPMSRRKAGTLVPLETEILAVAFALLRAGRPTFHGFGLAQTMREQRGSRSLTAHGTLYKALGRLEELGFVATRWEETPAIPGRPRRRLYELTGEGAEVGELALGRVMAAQPRRLAADPT
jgi:PadR family transcriptional regulator, regulatory protein PadR